MYRGRSVGVVVPAHNEAGLVGDVIATVPEFVDRIYVVDDASTDDTWEEIVSSVTVGDQGSESKRRATVDGGLDRRVVALRHEQNRGVGGAIKTGYLRARRDGMDVTAVMAGDGQMPPEELSSLIDPVVGGRADYAKGNRLALPEFRRDMGAWRSFGNTVLSVLTKIASGYWQIADSQNGYTAISRGALESVDIESMYEYYGYCNDLLVRLNANDQTVADVPMQAIYGEEQSGISYHDYIPRVSILLLRSFLWRLWTKYVRNGFHPIAALYPFGALGTGIGLAGFFKAIRDRRGTLGSTVSRSLPALVVSAVGVLSLLLAMLLDYWEGARLEVLPDE